MSSFKKLSTKISDGTVPDDRHGEEGRDAYDNPERHSPAHLDRLADLVACGEVPLPLDLPMDQLERLASEIRKRRRERLVGFVAHAIAADIHRSREP